MSTPGFQPLFQQLFKAPAQLPLAADQIGCRRNWLAALEAPGFCLRLIQQTEARPACPDCGNARCQSRLAGF